MFVCQGLQNNFVVRVLFLIFSLTLISLSFLDIQNENYFQKPRLLYQPNQASPENNKGYEKLTFSNEK